MTVRVTVRIPDELHTSLVEHAEQDRRSLHSEILWLIEEALAGRAESAEGTAHGGADS